VALFIRAYRLVLSDLAPAHSATADSVDGGIAVSAAEVSGSEGVDLVAGSAAGDLAGDGLAGVGGSDGPIGESRGAILVGIIGILTGTLSGTRTALGLITVIRPAITSTMIPMRP
jgi:hypothetical protein